MSDNQSLSVNIFSFDFVNYSKDGDSSANEIYVKLFVSDKEGQ